MSAFGDDLVELGLGDVERRHAHEQRGCTAVVRVILEASPAVADNAVLGVEAKLHEKVLDALRFADQLARVILV